MNTYTSEQKYITENICKDATMSHWRDYKWQLKHSIKDIQTFEEVTGITIPLNIRGEIEKTISKFPLSITPYYASLIDRDNFQNDPIFKQAFPDPRELIISRHEMEDPLHEDYAQISGQGIILRKQHMQHVLQALYAKKKSR
jgi:lysine 2,3-aminomutase